MNENAQRFQPSGLLALDQRAFGLVVSQVKPPERKVERVGKVAVVRIHGPLEHHSSGGFCDTYEDLTRRFAEAFASDAEVVVLDVDSPGGLVSGCFETSLSLRAAREASGKPLIGYVSGHACSAAYALVVQADRIVAAPGSFVGHVGVFEARLDVTKVDEAMGMQWAFVVSGDRKVHGNPHVPITEYELAVRQRNVDANASVFFDLVAKRRPTTVEKLKALQAGTFSGSAAIDHGLADEVGTFEGLLASIAGQEPAPAGGAKGLAMSMRDDLEKASKGEGEDAEKAKRALKAWDGDEEKKKDEEAKAKAAKEEEDAKASAAAKAKAEDEEKKKDEEAKAAQSASSQSSEMKAVIESQQRIEKANRRMILDSRPDLTAEQRAFAETLPVDKAQEYLSTIPKSAKPNHAAAITPAGTRAEGQTDNGMVSQLPPSEKAILDAQMGLSAITYTGVENTPLKVVLGAPVPVKREAKVG